MLVSILYIFSHYHRGRCEDILLYAHKVHKGIFAIAQGEAGKRTKKKKKNSVELSFIYLCAFWYCIELILVLEMLRLWCFSRMAYNLKIPKALRNTEGMSSQAVYEPGSLMFKQCKRFYQKLCKAFTSTKRL